MPVVLTDQEIDELVRERKVVSRSDLASLYRFKKKGKHQEASLSVVGERGNAFRITVRKAVLNPLDFSVILAYQLPDRSRLFRLRRYNGKSHEHANRPIERKPPFYDFHIHQATERYQALGADEEYYAEPTNRYATVEAAIECLLEDCGFVIDDGNQGTLFN
jgi:hypothetical protein